MNATSPTARLRVADIADSEASHSTTKSTASLMGFSDAISSSSFAALNAFSA